MNSIETVGKLDLMQRLFYIMNRYGGVTSIYMLDTRGYLDTTIMEKAASIVMSRHPLLHSIIRMDEKGHPLLEKTETAAIPLVFTSISGEADIHPVIEREMKRDFISSGLLWNILFLNHENDRDRNTILFSASHIIADGHTLIMFINELLDVYDALVRGNESSKVSPGGDMGESSFEQVYHQTPSTLLKAGHCFREAVKMFTPVTPVVPDEIHAPLERRCTKIIFRTMDEKLLDSLKSRSSDRGATLNATLLGALLFTLPFFVEKKRMMRFTLSTNVTLRSDFPELKETWGVFAPALQLARKISWKSDFWETVRSIKRESDGLIHSRAYVRLLQLQVWTLCSPLFQRVLEMIVHGAPKGRLTGASLSNMGKVSLTKNNGFLRIESLNCFGSQHGLGNVFTFYCNTLETKLYYNIAYVPPIIGDTTAHRFMAQMEKVLETAAYNDHFSLKDIEPVPM